MSKQSIRERIWNTLEERGEARFPFPPHGRIPNFAGADRAADRLQDVPEWEAADVIKANPDAPQRPVRRDAIAAGKTVYMAAPRLRGADPFIHLDPARIDDPDRASTIGGADDLGHRVGPSDMEPIDLVVAGSVAVTTTGQRIGKGEGYSDLEFAILREFELISDQTTTATTIHELQLLSEPIDSAPHDVPIEILATPDRVIRTGPEDAKPAGIDWSLLEPEQIAEMPILQDIRRSDSENDS